MWERELRKIKGLYDNRLRASQQKSSKMEQALTNQTYQVTYELVFLVHVFSYFSLNNQTCQVTSLQNIKDPLKYEMCVFSPENVRVQTFTLLQHIFLCV